MGFMTAAIVGSSLVGAAASSSASKSQARAAQQAADAQVEAARISSESLERIANQQLDLNRQVYADQTQRFAPFLDAGRDALGAYNFEMGLGARPMVGQTPLSILTQPVTGADGTTSQRFTVGGQSFDTRDAAEMFARQNATGGMEYAGIELSPAARFALEQGRDTVEAGAAARNGLNSGATLAGLERLRFGLAAGDRENQLNRLAGLVDMGQGAAGMQASAGNAFASNSNNALSQLSAGLSNNALAAGQAQAQGFIGAGNARAAGTMGVANALAGGVNNLIGWQGYQNMTNSNRLFGGNSWG